jgi:hypothetical protein
MNIEAMVEKSRQELINRNDFTIGDLFNILDFKSKGKISYNQFYKFLKDDLLLRNLETKNVEELF